VEEACSVISLLLFFPWTVAAAGNEDLTEQGV